MDKQIGKKLYNCPECGILLKKHHLDKGKCWKCGFLLNRDLIQNEDYDNKKNHNDKYISIKKSGFSKVSTVVFKITAITFSYLRNVVVFFISVTKYVIILLLTFLLFYHTNPDYDYHQNKLSKHMTSEIGIGDGLFGNGQSSQGRKSLIDSLLGSVIDFGINISSIFFVEDYLIFSVGKLKIENSNSYTKPIITFGILGMVFVVT